MPKPTPRHRINMYHTGALITVSAFVDILQIFIAFIPFVGFFITMLLALVINFILWVWFLVLGVGFADKTSRLFINIATRGTELLPVVDALPMLTLGTILIILQVNREDKKYNKKKKKEYKAYINKHGGNAVNSIRTHRFPQQNSFPRTRHVAANDNKRPLQDVA